MIASQIHSAFGGGAAGFSHGGSGATPSPRRVTGASHLALPEVASPPALCTRPLHPPPPVILPGRGCHHTQPGVRARTAWVLGTASTFSAGGGESKEGQYSVPWK